MDATSMVHICLETPGAPGPDGHELGERWQCACGDSFVFREGFNRGGYLDVAWWPAPTIPQPRRTVRRGLLFGPRKG